jgi:hypothetical protein
MQLYRKRRTHCQEIAQWLDLRDWTIPCAVVYWANLTQEPNSPFPPV